MSADSKRKALAIADFTSSVVDTGRRGIPKPGCDCVQCFGYCQYDGDKAARDARDARTWTPPTSEWWKGTLIPAGTEE